MSQGPGEQRAMKLSQAEIRAGLEKDAYGRAHILGLAAQAQTILVGPRSTDKPVEPALDGHEWSQVADHPDGRFALNTAATSSYSLDANRGPRHLFDERSKRLDGEGALSQAHQDARTSLRAFVDAAPGSFTLPRQKLIGSEPLRTERTDQDLVATAQEAPTRLPTGNLLSGEWTAPQLAGIGVGTLLLGSLASKVF